MQKNKKASSQEEKQYEVPPGGSLGLLALGYKGLIAWKAAKEKYLNQKKTEENEKEK